MGSLRSTFLARAGLDRVAEVKHGRAGAVLLSSAIAFILCLDLWKEIVNVKFFDDSVMIMLGLAGYLLYKGAKEGHLSWLRAGSLPFKAPQQQQQQQQQQKQQQQ
mmetsp:Transcript_38771/g.84940  ORF Transcript_38771/g.84940 Transcript_38771/m.84940 type:complete len:105 (+) Transcript_38771:81-395(+)